MGFAYEYQVEVTDRKITGRLISPGSEPTEHPEDLAGGEERELRRKTIEVLRLWLNRWTALTRMSQQAEYQNLLVRETFAVLGRQLYASIFFGNVERGFRQARDLVRAESAPLRVVLQFQMDNGPADDLAQLPWELLYADGDFLAKEHRLVLSRSLLREQAMIKTVPRDPPLEVRFLVTIPDTDAYTEQRANLIEALSQATEYSPSIHSRMLDHWDKDEAAEFLNEEPLPQVVHIVGVCKKQLGSGDDVEVQIYLDDGERADWRSGDALIGLFGQNPVRPEADRVRLVVLHLCEPSPLDFTATFERLAPGLIRQDIPAVLAMQYPLSGRAATRFVKKLYEALGKGQTIEEAVQAARSDLFLTYDRDRRLFGSPVLYMQSVDGQLLARMAGGSEGQTARPSTAPAQPAVPQSALDWLLGKLDGIKGPPEPRHQAREILQEEEELPHQLSAVEPHIARLARDYADSPELAKVFSALVEAVQEEKARRDVF